MKSSSKFGRVRNRKDLNITKKCEECGKDYHPFKQSIETQKYCSKECNYKNGSKEKKKIDKRICGICGNEYIPWSAKAKYCSHKCSGIAITNYNKKNPHIKNWERRSASGKNNTLDNYWRFAIYEQGNNKCEYCGKSGTLNAHHIFSRSNSAVRWDMDNGVCLCPAHHVFGNLSFHKAPAEMLEWIKEKRGLEWYNRLLLKARQIVKKREMMEKYKIILEGGRYR